MSDEATSTKVELTVEEYDRMLSKLPLRVVKMAGELEYKFKANPTIADQIEMFQNLLRTYRIYDYNSRVQKKCYQLYKQGVLFDHTPEAVADNDENEYAKSNRTKEEIVAAPTTKRKKKEMTLLEFMDLWINPAPKKKGEQHEE